MNPTPVAWFCEDESTLSFAEMAGCACVPLFTADQMQHARADALRDVAEKFHFDCDCGCPCDCYGPSTAKHQLLALAAELEKP